MHTLTHAEIGERLNLFEIEIREILPAAKTLIHYSCSCISIDVYWDIENGQSFRWVLYLNPKRLQDRTINLNQELSKYLFTIKSYLAF